MTARAHMLVYCDGDQCPLEGASFGDGEYISPYAHIVRLNAEHAGWIQRGSKDFCPHCAEKVKQRKSK